MLKQNADSYLRRLALCIAIFASSLIVLPLLALAQTGLPVAWPRSISNLLFFWPQYWLLPFGIRSAADEAVVSAGVTLTGMSVLWVLVLAGYARTTMAWRVRSVVLALLPTVLLMGSLVLVILGWLGWSPVLEGL